MDKAEELVIGGAAKNEAAELGGATLDFGGTEEQTKEREGGERPFGGLVMTPPWWGQSPERQRRSDDFPLPLGPMMMTDFPLGTCETPPAKASPESPC